MDVMLGEQAVQQVVARNRRGDGRAIWPVDQARKGGGKWGVFAVRGGCGGGDAVERG